MTQKQFENKFNKLSPKQKQVLEKLLAGESDKTIATSLHIEESTVRKHIENICNTFLGKADILGQSRRNELIDVFKRYKPKWVTLDEDDIEDQVEIDSDQKLDISDNGASVLISANSINSEGDRENNNIEENRETDQIEKTLREKTNCGQRRLFGIDKILERLGDNLRSPDDCWLMSLTGAGGIGKTSLTEKLISENATDSGFIKLAWTTAKRTYLSPDMSVQKRNNRRDINADSIIYEIASQLDVNLPPANKDHFTALQKKLQADPYLIVIDNLETLQEYERLLDRFNPFDPMCNIRPSKIILTSRKDVKANNCAAREIKLKGIDPSATLEMIRHEGQELDIIQQALDEELHPIYEKTQGNPLMILLVINLLEKYDEPLEKIFKRFDQDQDIQQFLYEESLESLSGNALRVLNSVAEYSPNSLIPRLDIQKTSGLNDDEFTQAITECSRYHLLESSRNTQSESRYSIHSLLYEFLNTSY
jgi:hypothetical protein